jgi:hypothetical protein
MVFEIAMPPSKKKIAHKSTKEKKFVKNYIQHMGECKLWWFTFGITLAISTRCFVFKL